MMSSSSISPNLQNLLILEGENWISSNFKLEYQYLFLQSDEEEGKDQIEQLTVRKDVIQRKISLPVQYEELSSPIQGKSHVILIVDESDKIYCSFPSLENKKKFIDKISQNNIISKEPILLKRRDEEFNDDSDSSSSSTSVRDKLRRASFRLPKMKDLLNTNGKTESHKALKNDSSSVSLSLLSPPKITDIKKNVSITTVPQDEPSFKHSLKPLPQEKPIIKEEKFESEYIRKGHFKRLNQQATVLKESSWITQWAELDLSSGKLKLFSEILSRKILRDTIDLTASIVEIISFDNCSEIYTFKISPSSSEIVTDQTINPASLSKVYILSVENDTLFNNWISYILEIKDVMEKIEKENQAKVNAIPLLTSDQSKKTESENSTTTSNSHSESATIPSPSINLDSSPSSTTTTPAQTPFPTPSATPNSTPTIAPKKLKMNTNFLANLLNSQFNPSAPILPVENVKQEETKQVEENQDNSPQALLMKQLKQKQKIDTDSHEITSSTTISSTIPAQLSPIQEIPNEDKFDSPIPFPSLTLEVESLHKLKENYVIIHLDKEKIKEASELISELTFSVEKINFPLADRLLRRLLIWYCSNGFSLTNGDDVDRFVDEIQVDPQTDNILRKFFSKKFDLFESWGSFLSILHQFEDTETKKMLRNPFHRQINQLNENEEEDELSLVVNVKHSSNSSIEFSFKLNNLFNVNILTDIFAKNLGLQPEIIYHVVPQILYNTEFLLYDENNKQNLNIPPSLILPSIESHVSSNPSSTDNSQGPQGGQHSLENHQQIENKIRDSKNQGLFSLVISRFSEDYVLLQDLLLYQEELVKEWWTKIANNKQLLKQKDAVINDLYEQITTLKEKRADGESNVKNYVNDIFSSSTQSGVEKSKKDDEDDEGDELLSASGIKRSYKSILNELRNNKQSYQLEKQKLLDEIMILKLSLNPNTDKFYQQLQQNEELRKNLEDKLVESHIEIDKQKEFIFCLQNDIENKNIIINECESQISSLKYKTKELEAEIEALKVKVNVAEMIAKTSISNNKPASSATLANPLSPGYSDNIDLLTLASLDSPTLKNSRRDVYRENKLGNDSDHPYLSNFEIKEQINIHIPPKPHSYPSSRDEELYPPPPPPQQYSDPQDYTRHDLISSIDRGGKLSVFPPSHNSGNIQRSTSSLRSYMSSNPQTPVKTPQTQQPHQSPYQIHSTKNFQQMYNEYKSIQEGSNLSHRIQNLNSSQNQYQYSINSNPVHLNQDNFYQASNVQSQNQHLGSTSYIQSLYAQQSQSNPLRNALQKEMKINPRGTITPERRLLSRKGTTTPNTPESVNMNLLSSQNSRFMSPTNSWYLKSNR